MANCKPRSAGNRPEPRGPRRIQGSTVDRIGAGSTVWPAGRFTNRVMFGRELTLGIDFGTSYSSAGALVDGKVHLVLEHGEPAIPSAVYIPKRGHPIVGRDALLRLPSDPGGTIVSIKRLLGRRVDDPQTKRIDSGVGYKIKPGPGSRAILEVNGHDYACEQVVASILAHLRNLAARRFGARIKSMVVGVPAAAGVDYVNALRRAARLANLKLIQVVPEPVAGALAFGMGVDPGERNLVVLDFGGGTFDVSLMEQRESVFRTVRCVGDELLGGDDFDECFGKAVADSIYRTSKFVVQNDAVRWQNLLFRCESVKRLLTTATQARLRMQDAYIYQHSRADIDVQVERPWLEGHWKQLRQRARAVVKRCLSDLPRDYQIDDVVLIGGTTLIPCVRQDLAAMFPNANIHRKDWASLAVTTGLTMQTWAHAPISTSVPVIAPRQE